MVVGNGHAEDERSTEKTGIFHGSLTDVNNHSISSASGNITQVIGVNTAHMKIVPRMLLTTSSRHLSVNSYDDQVAIVCSLEEAASSTLPVNELDVSSNNTAYGFERLPPDGKEHYQASIGCLPSTTSKDTS